MKTILTKAQAKQFLNENWKLETLFFKWSKTGVCSIYDKRDDKTKFTAAGYGYDKKGTALGQLINTHFSNELKKLSADRGGGWFAPRSGFYGLNHYNPKAKSHSRKYLKRATEHTKSYVDGGCGFDCMKQILAKIGLKMNFVHEGKNHSIYTLSI
jgi:hypothetical protein